MISIFTLVLTFSTIGLIAAQSSGTPKDPVPNTTPRLPENLCGECSINLNYIDQVTGDFQQPKQIFNINDDPSTGCLAKLGEYVSLNDENDLKTKNAYMQYVNDKNKNSQDYWRLERIVYTYCEMCCDCIDVIKPAKDLALDVYRPNCALHDYYDVTNLGVFPDALYQNYETGEIIGGSLADDLAIWLECKQYGQVMIRKNQGLAGYFADGKCEPDADSSPLGDDDVAPIPAPITAPKPAPVPVSGDEGEGDVSSKPQSGLLVGRKLLDLTTAQKRVLDFAANHVHASGRRLHQTIDCNSPAKDAAFERMYANLKALTKWIGCAQPTGYYACHQMEYTQGRVCGLQCGEGDDCNGKPW